MRGSLGPAPSPRGPPPPFAPHAPRVGDELLEPLHGDAVQPEHDDRPASVTVSGEELVRLAFEQRLLLGLVPDEEHRDVGADDPPPTGLTFGIGPDEAAAPHPEVEALALDLHRSGQ